MPSVVVALTLRNTEPDTIRRALMWDALKWNLQLTKLTKKTLPGFYMHKGKLQEVFYDSTAAAYPDHQAGETSGSHLARYQPLPHRPVELRGQSFSANDVISNPPSSRLQINTDAPLRLRTVPASEAVPFVYTIDMTFGSFAPDNSVSWQCIPSTTTCLKLRVMIDTGGHGRLWTYSTEPTVYGISPAGQRVALTDQQRSMLGTKNKIQFSKQGNTSLRIGYGKNMVDVQLTTAPIRIWDHFHGAFNIGSYRFGAVVGLTPPILLQPFDGICGLGRSHSAASDRTGVTIVQHMFRTNVIQEEQFYVCCRYEPDTIFGHGFVIFGGWPDSFDFVPAWTSVLVPQTAAKGKWELDLHHISIIVPGMEPIPFPMEYRVKVDNGTARSVFKAKDSQRITEKLDEIWKAAGFPSFDVPDAVQVEIGFTNTTPAGFLRKKTETVSVRGSAKRFFVVPDLDSDTAPRVHAFQGREDETGNASFVLGTNFFRTFLLGFRDTAVSPAVQIALQP